MRWQGWSDASLTAIAQGRLQVSRTSGFAVFGGAYARELSCQNSRTVMCLLQHWVAQTLT